MRAHEQIICFHALLRQTVDHVCVDIIKRCKTCLPFCRTGLIRDDEYVIPFFLKSTERLRSARQKFKLFHFHGAVKLLYVIIPHYAVDDAVPVNKHRGMTFVKPVLCILCEFGK